MTVRGRAAAERLHERCATDQRYDATASCQGRFVLPVQALRVFVLPVDLLPRQSQTAAFPVPLRRRLSDRTLPGVRIRRLAPLQPHRLRLPGLLLVSV